MKKILGICGSAAPKSSTKKLIETALAVAAAAGAEVELVDAAKLDIHGCKGCMACKRETARFCAQKDDMTLLYDRINAADAVIIGSPIYFGEITGQSKCFLDRMYAFFGPNGSRMTAGKKAAAVITQGVEDPVIYQTAAATLVSGFRYCGAEIHRPVIAGGLHTADDLSPAMLEEAVALGKRLLA